LNRNGRVLYLVSIRKTSLSDIADCRWKMMQTLSAATVLNVGAWQDELLKKKACRRVDCLRRRGGGIPRAEPRINIDDVTLSASQLCTTTWA
jgi:hypothetical protein